MKSGRTRPCSSGVKLERLRKAEQFWKVGADVVALADDEGEIADAASTLFITSGIASADVICCARLGEFAAGEDHRHAIALLRAADAASASSLSALLDLKSKAAYSHVGVSEVELRKATRAAEQLLATARRVASG